MCEYKGRHGAGDGACALGGTEPRRRSAASCAAQPSACGRARTTGRCSAVPGGSCAAISSNRAGTPRAVLRCWRARRADVTWAWCQRPSRCARGLGDRLGDAQIPQSVARADQRRGFSPDDAPEVLELQRNRIGAFHLGDTHVERRPPRSVACARVGLQAHGRYRQRAQSPRDDVTILIRMRRVRFVLARRLLPTARACRGVRGSMNVPRAPPAKLEKLMATVSSTGKPRVAWDDNAWTVTMSPHSMDRLWTS